MAPEDQNLCISRDSSRPRASRQGNFGVPVRRQVLIEWRHGRIGCCRRLCLRLLHCREPQDQSEIYIRYHRQSSSVHPFPPLSWNRCRFTTCSFDIRRPPLPDCRGARRVLSHRTIFLIPTSHTLTSSATFANKAVP